MSFVKNPNRNSKRCKTTLMNIVPNGDIYGGLMG